MRTLLLICLFVINTAFVEPSKEKAPATKENVSSDKQTTSETVDTYELNINKLNKYQISEELEEIKEKLEALENRKKDLEEFKQFLDSYNLDISSASAESIRTLFTAIEQNAGKNNKVIEENEAKIIDLLNSLYISYYPVQSQKSSDYFKAAFKQKIEKLLNLFSSGLFLEFSDYPDGALLSDMSKIKEFKDLLPQIETTINSVKEALKAEIESNTKSINDLKEDIKKQKKRKFELTTALSEQETQINGLSIKLGLPLFCGTILLLFLGPKLIECRRRRRNTEQDDDDEASSKRVLVEICTVLLLTMSILILGLSDKINSDVLGTLIGGISGYVLNKAMTAIPPSPSKS